MIMIVFILIICMILQCTNAFMKTIPSLSSSKRMYMLSDISSLHDTLFNKLKDKYVLKETFFAEDNGAKEWKNLQSSGKCGWWDEKLGGKLTGVSNYVYTTSSMSSYNLNVWMGPGYLVPHLLLKINDNAGIISITCDYVPRGSFPLGSDQTYVDTYYGKDSIAIYDSNMALSGVKPLPPSKSFSSRILNSPIYTSITGLTSDSASIIATKHIDLWLQWMETAEKVDARQRGAINTRDDKLRQYAFRSNLAEVSTFVNKQFATSLAAAHTGPIAEAYVGINYYYFSIL